jgi:outer membrane protein assembly factor BamB
LLGLTSLAAPSSRPFPAPEEWPAYRRDGSLQARSPARGNIASPRIVWQQFVGVLESQVVLEPAEGKSRLALPLEESVSASIPPTLAPENFLPKPDLVQGEARSTTTTFADVLPDEPGREKIDFESGFAKPTVNGQWQKCVGRCFARRDGKWVQVWETQPIDLLFQPLPLVGDFDGDGKPEVAILPFHELLLLDARTGRIKDRCRFTDTRSYGFFGAYDFAHDGRTEFLVQADFSKHVDVLGFRDGKLTLLWQRNVEADISNPQIILRVGPNPAADVDGDGQAEVLTTIFNERGDQRWRITVHEALTGRVKAELPDEYLVALLSLDGSSVSQLLTITATGAGVPEFGTIRVRSLKDNHPTTLWENSNAAWETWEPPLPANVQSTATFGRTTVMSHAGSAGVTVVIRESNAPRTGAVTLSAARWTGTSFQRLMSVSSPIRTKDHALLRGRLSGAAQPSPSSSSRSDPPSAFGYRPLAIGYCPHPSRVAMRGRPPWEVSHSPAPLRLAAVGLDDSGRLLVRAYHAPGEAASLQVVGAKATLLATKRATGSPGPVAVVWPDGANEPTVFAQGHGEEIVAFHPPTKTGRAKLTRIAGRGQSTSWPEVRGPVVADLAGNGHRQLLLATASPEGCARFEARDLSGRTRWHHDFPGIPGTPPVWNTGGIILWQTGHFTDPPRQDVLVTIRRSMMHSEETALLSGRDGRELWHRNRQISQRGVGGTPFAIADYDGDGLDDLASLHPSILYLLKGNTGADLIAKDATWKQAPAQPVYWGQPIAGDFLQTGRPSIFFGGRSMTGLVRADGSLVWWDALDHSPPDWPAFGNFSGQGRLEAIGAGYPDGVRCYDAATGKVLWHLPMPAAGTVIGSASADLDGDGRDEALFVIGQQLVCLAAGSTPAEGRVLWQLPLPVQTGPPSLAVLDRQNGLSILLAGADGSVYAVR